MHDEKKTILIQTILVFLFPFVLCNIYCLIKGFSFFHIYIPASVKNDSLFYYKVVEGMIHY